MDKSKNVEYMCIYCGTKMAHMGRKMPGKCPRRTGDQPHRWVGNRKY